MNQSAFLLHHTQNYTVVCYYCYFFYLFLSPKWHLYRILSRLFLWTRILIVGNIVVVLCSIRPLLTQTGRLRKPVRNSWARRDRAVCLPLGAANLEESQPMGYVTCILHLVNATPACTLQGWNQNLLLSRKAFIELGIITMLSSLRVYSSRC